MRNFIASAMCARTTALPGMLKLARLPLRGVAPLRKPTMISILIDTVTLFYVCAAHYASSRGIAREYNRDKKTAPTFCTSTALGGTEVAVEVLVAETIMCT